MNRDTERRLMDLAFACYKDISAYALWDTVLPIGIIARIRWIFWRKPVFYDSSLMARSCALPSSTLAGELGDGNIAGPASAILEIPVSWYLDDFPHWRIPVTVRG